MENMRRILVCLGAAAVLVGCGGRGTAAGGGGQTAAEAGSSLPGDGSGGAGSGLAAENDGQEAAGGQGEGVAENSGQSGGTAENGGQSGLAVENSGQSGLAAENDGQSDLLSAAGGDYGELSAELARREGLALSEAYGFDSWAADVEAALYSVIRAGMGQGKELEEMAADSASVSMRATPWVDCGQPAAGGGLAAGGYRAAALEIGKAGIAQIRQAVYLESRSGELWRLDGRGWGGVPWDNFSLTWVPGLTAGRADLYLLAAGPAEGGDRTEIRLWSLDGAADGQVTCGEVLAQRLPGARDQEVQDRVTETGFAVSGMIREGGSERGLELKVELAGGQISVKRSAAVWEAQTEQAPEYALLLGLAGDEDLRTLWVTAENGVLTCRELPDVIQHWTKDGMKSVRYLHYRRQEPENGRASGSAAAAGTDDDWKLLAAEAPAGPEAVTAYAEENYAQFEGRGRALQIRERLEFVGDDSLSATARVVCFDGEPGGWSEVHAFMSPLEIALQNGAHLALTDLSGTKNSTRNDLDRELEHYEAVYGKGAGQAADTAGAEWETLPEDGPYLARRAGAVEAVLPVATMWKRPDGGLDQAFREPLTLDVKLTDSLTGYDKLSRKFDRIRYYIPGAEDAVSAPGGSLLAVLTEKQVQLFVQPRELEQLLAPQLCIPVADDERIVSAVWVKAEDRETVEAAIKAAPDSGLYMGNGGPAGS